MRSPDARLVRIRRWLANRIQVSPAPGEAWCLRCQLNGRHTLIVNADSWTRHARQHNAELPGVPFSVSASWPQHKHGEEDDQ